MVAKVRPQAGSVHGHPPAERVDANACSTREIEGSLPLTTAPKSLAKLWDKRSIPLTSHSSHAPKVINWAGLTKPPLSPMARKPISKAELNSIKRSAAKAEVRLTTRTTLLGKLHTVLRRKSGESEQQNMARRVLLSLEVGQKRDLRDKTYAKVIAAAARRDDRRFFIRMGKALSRKPYEESSLLNEYDKRNVEWYLVKYWARKQPGLPELFYLTSGGLVNVIRKRLNYICTEEAIVKIRQRLGLKAFPRIKIKVDQEGNVIDLKPG